MKTKRTILIRIGVVAVLVLIALIMLRIGRGHTVYFDNKKMDYEGKTIETPYQVEVYVGGEKVAKLRAKERGMATKIGQGFEYDLVVTQEKKGEEVESHYSMSLPYGWDGIVINLPGLLAGLPEDAYITQFIPAPVVEEEEDVTIDDEFNIGDDF